MFNKRAGKKELGGKMRRKRLDLLFYITIVQRKVRTLIMHERLSYKDYEKCTPRKFYIAWQTKA